MPANISTHITYDEATKSQTAIRQGIDNTPNAEQLAAMRLVAHNIFEPVRKHFGGKPIAVTSFFRCEALNQAIGGSAFSQHRKGEAIDVDGDVHGDPGNTEIFHFIRENLNFDQLIWEYGTDDKPDWVHCSYKAEGNRKQVLRAVKGRGYIPWTP